MIPTGRYDQLAFLLQVGTVTVEAALGSTSPAALACMPFVMPVAIDNVSPEHWMANKRALAFHRSTVLSVYLQFGFAGWKAIQGNLVGAAYDMFTALCGWHAISAEGQQFFPTYICISGFNGIISFLQTIQMSHGIPVQQLPLSIFAQPVLSIASAYFGMEFVQEVNAISVGRTCFGAQDTCFVKVMSSDCWPWSLTPGERPAGAPGVQGPSFQGHGHRLG